MKKWMLFGFIALSVMGGVKGFSAAVTELKSNPSITERAALLR